MYYLKFTRTSWSKYNVQYNDQSSRTLPVAVEIPVYKNLQIIKTNRQ